MTVRHRIREAVLDGLHFVRTGMVQTMVRTAMIRRIVIGTVYCGTVLNVENKLSPNC